MGDGIQKVIWCEGMFLQPHHFQQQERYWQSQINSGRMLQQYFWGFNHLKFDRAQLKFGILALNECSGVMPDGTYFYLSATETILPTLRINEEMSGASIMLTLPFSGRHRLESHADPLLETLVRYRTVETEVHDRVTPDGEKVLMQVGELNFHLMPEQQLRDSHCFLAVAQIREVRMDGEVVLVEEFIPPILSYRCIPNFAQRVDDFLGRLRVRRNQLRENLKVPGNATSAGILPFLYLQSVSRAMAWLNHLNQQDIIHPEKLHRGLLALAGEWQIFSPDPEEDQLMSLPAYNHQFPAKSFFPLLEELHRILNIAARPRVIPLPLNQEEFGIYRARIDDICFFQSVRLILAVKANVPANEMAARLKVGLGDHIQDMVNLQLPGFPVTSLLTLPGEIPYFDDYQYFVLDVDYSVNEWLKDTSGLAIYVSGDFPDGKLVLWAYGEYQK